MIPVLEVNHLSFAFTAGCPIFADLNFVLHSGECVGLVGSNGSGKSTLIWCLLGLLKADGEIHLFGKRWNRKALRQVGAVFQNPEDQLFMPSVSEDLQLTLKGGRMSPNEAAIKAAELLLQAGLEKVAGRSASHLSLGERKRAAIAVALAQNPDMLMLDEPSAELDGRATRQLTEVLLQLPIARLIASHDLGLLRKVTSRLLVLGEGKIIAGGKTEDILTNEFLLLRAGLI